MPIRKGLRGFYPTDGRQLSDVIRFERAEGRSETCGRPPGCVIHDLGDGRWFDLENEVWRDGQGSVVDWADFSQYQGRLRQTGVILATAHLDDQRIASFGDNNHSRNLKALCQRCHLLHDRQEHCRRRRLVHCRRRALGDLFDGAYPRW